MAKYGQIWPKMAYFGLYGSIGAQKAKYGQIGDLAEIVVLGHFGGIPRFGHIWPFEHLSSHIGQNGLFWPIFGLFGPYWASEAKYGQIGLFGQITRFGRNSGFGSFWWYTPIWPFSAISSHIGPNRPNIGQNGLYLAYMAR